MIGEPAKAAEAFEDAGGDVGGAGVDHGVVIGERNVAQKSAVVVAVESAPAAVAILHAEEPLKAAANGGFHARGVGKFHTLEGHEDERSVVDVGIKIVAEFEGPAAGLGVFIFYLPVAGAENLLGENPVGGAHQSGLVRGDAGLFERDHGDGGVPNGRDTGL